MDHRSHVDVIAAAYDPDAGMSLDDLDDLECGMIELTPAQSFFPNTTPYFRPGFKISAHSTYMEPLQILWRTESEWTSFERSDDVVLTDAYPTLLWLRDYTNASTLKLLNLSDTQYKMVRTIGRKLSNRNTAARSKRKSSSSSIY
jgi:hypothetical protein